MWRSPSLERKRCGMGGPKEATFNVRPRSRSTRSAESKVTKNRLHLDFRPDDPAAEVERMVALGARRVGVVILGARKNGQFR